MTINFNSDIPLESHYDVVVAGGGPAGCAAALAAARHGAKTLLLEYSSCLGGMGTNGMVPAWCPYSDKEKIIYRGISQEIFEKVRAGMPHLKKTDVDWVPIDPELLKYTLDKMLSEAGVEIIFNVMVVGTVTGSAASSGRKRITHVVTAHKCGLRAWAGNVFIDCTGDADLVGLAGIRRLFGDEKTGEVQPSSLCFALSNVDMHYYHCMPHLHMNNPDGASWKAVRSGKYPDIKDGHCCHGVTGPGTIGFNAGHIWDVDPSNPRNISQALIKGRRIASQYQQALKEYLPEVFGSAWLSQTAAAMGIRETWRIIGDYELTVDDYIQRRSFPDEIGRNCYYLDVHNSEEDGRRIADGKISGEEGCNHYKPGESHGLPRTILQVKEAENILAAGRNVSTDHKVQGSVRVMPVCFVMGEAAGVMAALTGEGKDIRDVDTGLLRDTLRKDGAYFY